MIYTVTFNPALDYVVGIDTLEHGVTNRTRYERLVFGGKGLNVSVVLSELGVENTALGFVAGFTGEEIQRQFEGLGGKSEFIRLSEGLSRINVKIKSDTETEINASGPAIDGCALEKLTSRLDKLQSGDILVLAGSIPGSLPDSLYSDIMQRLDGTDVTVVVDATRELLVNVLEYRPFLIKPNNHELGEIFGAEVNTRSEAAMYAKKLQDMGARNVLVSMAGEGAVLVSESGSIIESEAPKGEVKNSVGAGDSMVAGFLAGWINSGDYASALHMGVAAGSASAFSEVLATKEEIESVYNSFDVLK